MGDGGVMLDHSNLSDFLFYFIFSGYGIKGELCFFFFFRGGPLRTDPALTFNKSTFSATHLSLTNFENRKRQREPNKSCFTDICQRFNVKYL